MPISKFASGSFRNLLLWSLAAPTVFALTLVVEKDRSIWAQTANALDGVEIPATLPNGTTLNIVSSEAMRPMNEALQNQFTQQYDGTQVAIDYQSADGAIEALQNGEIDLAAIGRGLSAAEQQAGLEPISLARHKIALITSPDNPFSGSLTVEQFAQIFRGEITNWSEVGGPDAPIVLVDRPTTSDTRQAFFNYPLFQNASDQTPPSAVNLDADSTSAVIEALGPNSISYAIAEQVLGNPAVKILPMHNTMPDDPRYPFSQALSYVYRSDDPSPAALAFLGYATNPDNAAVIAAAREAIATADTTPDAPATVEADDESPEASAAAEPAAEKEAAAVDGTVAPAEEEAAAIDGTVAPAEEEAAAPLATGRTRGIPWWPWILALPVLGGLLWWLLKDRTPAAAPLGGAAEPERRVILTPRDCRDAYAYWELPPSEVEALKRQNCSLALRLHDVTDVEDVDHQAPHSMKQFDCDTVARGDRHLPISFDDRDYLVELGYRDQQNNWHALVRSDQVRVPACPTTVPNPTGGVAAAASAAGLATAGVAATRLRSEKSSAPAPVATQEPARIILTPQDCRHAYAYWELPQAQMNTLTQENRSLRLRLYDVTELPGAAQTGHKNLQEFDCPLKSPGDRHIPIPIDNRDYVAELGYLGTDRQWHILAKADSVRVPACLETTGTHPDGNGSIRLTTATGLEARGTTPTPVAPIQPGQVTPQTTGLVNRVADAAETAGKRTSGLVGATLAGGAAAAAGAAALGSRVATGQEKSPAVAGSGAGVRSDAGGHSRIILVPRSAEAAYAYWEIAPAHRQAVKQQGGRTMALRIHDATNLELDYQTAHSTQEYVCQETDQDKHVTIPTPDRDYVAELGYLTAEGQWLRLLRSLHVRVG